jgi:hypothetical protein
MLVHWSYIYCYILWILAIIYVIMPIKLPYSPLISLILAGIYTSFSQVLFHKYVHITKKILVLLIEYLMIFMVALKSGELLPLFTSKTLIGGIKGVIKNIKPSILINILVFGIYLIYLGVNGTSFYKVYFYELPQSHNKPEETVWSYLKRRFTYDDIDDNNDIDNNDIDN